MIRIPIYLEPSDFERDPLEPNHVFIARDAANEPFRWYAGIQRVTDDNAAYRPIEVLGQFLQMEHALLFAMLVEDTEAMTALREVVEETGRHAGCVHGGNATHH